MKRVQRIGPFLVGNLDKVLFLMKPVLRNYPAKHHVEAFLDFRGELTSLIPHWVNNSHLSANYANVT